MEEEESRHKRLDRELIEAIVARTALISVDQIKAWDIERIEEVLGIKAVAPKTYFAWELGEKEGWQTYPYNFVSRKEFEKRERRLDKLMSRG